MPLPSLHDVSFDMEHATREAREATFAPPSKRSKAGWPHRTPTATDLARAGFYFKPSPHSNDNTACFLCDRNLDGWEKDDDPIQEHLKHAEDCGWAILMSIEADDAQDTANMEDPTGQKLTDARTATFAVGWPHEGKRGWTCKADKMIEAGWYFAPTAGSEDYVSCVYCKLSLDGWEPKDNPFEEHYSRSPGCPFFVFAGTTAPSKRPKAKKGRASRASRTSKASRLSTQSNATIQSEAPSIPDLDESIDTSAVSVLSTASTATVKGKRKAAAPRTKAAKPKRTKTAKSKKIEEMEPEPDTQTSQESLAGEVLYPVPQSQPQGELHKMDVPLETIEKATSEPETQADSVPDAAIGPPDVPAPTIPASAVSPVPIRSPNQRKKTSIAKSIPKPITRPATPTSQSPTSQPSDLENAPPSARPESVRPPLTQSKGTPLTWDPIDIEMELSDLAQLVSDDKFLHGKLTDAENQMSCQDWIKHMAEKAEGQLLAESENLVTLFEEKGRRALTVLESITCI